jgi:N-methylhydantoinase B
MPVEVAEVRFPFRVEYFEFAQDSGGPGKHRGGLGVHRNYRIIGHEGGMTATTDRVIHTPPWGIFGGKSGRPSITKVFRAAGGEEAWRKVSNLPLHDGDVVSFQTGGGGGYGSPLERKPEEVLLDVVSGYVSIRSALEDYGVVINETDMTIDQEETGKRRAELRQGEG